MFNWKGNENIKALGLSYEDHGVSLTNEHFRGLSNLEFLRLDKTDVKGNFKKLLSRLIWLDWQGCPTKTKRLRCLNLAKLIILDLSGSEVDHQWNGWKRIMKVLETMLFVCDYRGHFYQELTLISLSLSLVRKQSPWKF